MLDMGRVLAGPLCSAILEGSGADVVKLESPDGDLASVPLFEIFCNVLGANRGSPLILLKMREEEFQSNLWRADILVETSLT